MTKIEEVLDTAIRGIDPRELGFYDVPGEKNYCVLPLSDENGKSITGAVVEEAVYDEDADQWFSEIIKTISLDEVNDILEKRLSDSYWLDFVNKNYLDNKLKTELVRVNWQEHVVVKK